LIISVVLAACAEASSGSSADSGIIGKTIVDKGGSPLPTGGTSPFVPLAADIVVHRAGSSQVVATVRSGQDGRFRVELKPGTYRLTASNIRSAPVPTARPLDVTVGSGRYAEVVIVFDSGVRGP
jgi:hypothetical protein